jgi:hypothetical protein
LNQKGTLAVRRSWVYLEDEWAKRHPIFDGLPADFAEQLKLGYTEQHVSAGPNWCGLSPQGLRRVVNAGPESGRAVGAE